MTEELIKECINAFKQTNKSALNVLISKSNVLFRNAFTITSPQIIWEETISILKVDFKKHLSAFQSNPGDFVELVIDMVNKISKGTFYSVNRAVYLLEYYIEGFPLLLPSKELISYANIRTINESTTQLVALLNSLIIAKEIYHKVINDQFDEEKEIIHSSEIGLTQGIGMNHKVIVINIAHWLFSLLFSDSNAIQAIPLFFRHLKRQASENSTLALEIMGTKSDPCEFMLNLIFHHRFIQDPQSLSFLEWCMTSSSKDFDSKRHFTLEQLLLNSSIPDASRKTSVLSEILRGYLLEQYEYSSCQLVDHTMMCYVFCSFFLSSYSLLHDLTESIYKQYENINDISQRKLVDLTLCFIEYSLFVIDYMKLQRETIQTSPEEMKYICFYTYVEYAGLLSSFFPFGALVSCYLLKEVIFLFGFREQQPKVIFNYLCFLYQVDYRYGFSGQLEKFFSFIIQQIDHKKVSANNEWFFLSLGLYGTIPFFSLTEDSAIINWMKNPSLSIENIIKITEHVPYIRHYEAEILLKQLNDILDVPELFSLVNTNQTVLGHINEMLSYLLFHYDFIANDGSDCNFNNSEAFNHIIFSIINKLAIDVDEYFYLPKCYEPYRDCAKFIQFIRQKINAYIAQSSFLPFEVLSLKLSISNFHRDKSPHLSAFLIAYISNANHLAIEARQNKQIAKDLLQLLHLSVTLSSEEVKVMEELITSDLYHLDVCLFILMQLLSNECSQEIYNSINVFMTDLIEATHKLEFTFFLSIHKFFTNLLSLEYDSLNYLIKDKSDSSKLAKEILNSNDRLNGKYKWLTKDLTLQINAYKHIKSNWEEISKALNKGNGYTRYISSLNERNYPKSCVNLAEWRIFQDMREQNIQTAVSPSSKGELIYYYYNSLCKLDDNAQILQSYCMDSSIQVFIKEYCQFNSIPLSNNGDNSSLTSHFLLLSEAFLKGVSSKQLDNALQFNIPDMKNIDAVAEYIFLKRLLDLNHLLNTKSLSTVLLFKKKWEVFLRVFIKNSFNKMQGELYGKMAYVSICYDIDLIFKVITDEILKSANGNTFHLALPNKAIGETLRKVIMNKPSLLSKHLLQYKIRRAFCVFALQPELELHCLVGIMKIYKAARQSLKLSEYFEEYKRLLFLNKSFPFISDDMLYLCLKLQFALFPSPIGEFNAIYDIYLQKCNRKPLIRYELLQLKAKEKNGFRMDCLIQQLKGQMAQQESKKEMNDDYCFRANVYLNYLRHYNKKHFDEIHKEQITIQSLSNVLFEYLSIALKICLYTTNKKLLAIYLPQLMNFIFKIQKLFQQTESMSQSANKNHSKATKASAAKQGHSRVNKLPEYRSDFETILIEMRLLSTANTKIILPQLLICYSLPSTWLYQLAIDLLVKFSNENIDLSASWLAAYLSTSEKDIDALYQRGMDKLNYSKLYILSRQFGANVKKGLSNANQKTLSHYEHFQSQIKELFILVKKNKSAKSDKTDKSVKGKEKPEEEIKAFIQKLNSYLKTERCLIILPVLSNVSLYNPKLREELNALRKNKPLEDLKQYSTLFISEVSEKIHVIQSKEAPLKITFHAMTAYDIINKTGSGFGSRGVAYSFVLKGDVIDITKELKSTELFNEINSLFKLKSYDIDYQMALKQYLISPVTSHIVLVEWLVGTKTLQQISEEMRRKFAVKSSEMMMIRKSYLQQGEYCKIKEEMNLMFLHYHLSYPNPNDWWKAKRAYVISTAIWSMTGFFAGVGDRHLGNIMIGPTGECIHIDFGYVLGKGAILPVPEVVPFRLTRNLCRNLGVFEENGLFIFIAKKAIDLFHEYFTPLISRVEYYLFDPYNDEHSGNYMIRKLDELECFFLSDFSFDQSHMKVYNLVQQAKNTENIEKMFVGWTPDF